MMMNVFFVLMSGVALLLVACDNGGPGSEILSFDECIATVRADTEKGTYTGNRTNNGARESVNFLLFGKCTDASGSVSVGAQQGTITLSCGGPVRVCPVDGGAPTTVGCGKPPDPDEPPLTSEQEDIAASIEWILKPEPSRPWVACVGAPAGTVCPCGEPGEGTVTTSYL